MYPNQRAGQDGILTLSMHSEALKQGNFVAEKEMATHHKADIVVRIDESCYCCFSCWKQRRWKSKKN